MIKRYHTKVCARKRFRIFLFENHHTDTSDPSRRQHN